MRVVNNGDKREGRRGERPKKGGGLENRTYMEEGGMSTAADLVEFYNYVG